MKILQLLFLIALTAPAFGQNKTDLINCLDLIFDQPELQPAYSSHDATDGNLIIVQSMSNNRMGRGPTLNMLLSSFTDDDFRDVDNYVRVLNSNELEYRGIPEQATLRIFASGTETDITFRIETTHYDESQQYSWMYRLSKTDDEWEIIGSEVNKQRARLREN